MTLQAMTDQVNYGPAVSAVLAVQEAAMDHNYQVSNDLLLGLQELARQRVLFEQYKLLRMAHALELQLAYHLADLEAFHSPGLAAIVAAVVSAVKAIGEVIKTIVNIIDLLHLAEIHQVLMAIWPQYRQLWADILNKMSQASEIVGIGVDGVSHMLNAALGGINAIGSLTGKGQDWILAKRAEQGVLVMGGINAAIKEVTVNPSIVFDWVYNNYIDDTNEVGASWWKSTSDFIQNTAEIAQQVVGGLKTTVDELHELENALPEVVRKHIPSEIWSALDWADSVIDDKILPQLTYVINTTTAINNRLEDARTRLSALADKIGLPGDILLGVDDLPEYARLTQEQIIDEVASRELERQATAERADLQQDLDSLASIDEAINAGVPPVAFLTLESPARAALTGIKAEPFETWMIDGYSDTH